MKKSSYPLLVVLVQAIIFIVPAQSQEKKRLSFEQIFGNAEPKIIGKLPTISSWADDDHYLEMKKNEGDEAAKLYSVDVTSGEEKLYRDLNQYRTIVDSGIAPGEPVSYTSSYSSLIYEKGGDLYFLDGRNKIFKRLTQTEEPEKNPTISPDGQMIAFTRANNLFAIDLTTGKEYQYTDDGSDVVYSGRAAWLYYEEIFGRPTRYRAFWWSPDSRHLMFYRFDESGFLCFRSTILKVCMDF